MTKNIFRCVSCNSSIEHVDNKNSFQCKNCGSYYPVLFNQIPILIKDSHKLISNSYSQYVDHITEISTSKLNNSFEEEISSKYDNAVEANSKLIGELRDCLEVFNPCMSSLKTKFGNTYSVRFDYLRRDWCWYNEDESEIKVCLDLILKELPIEKCQTTLVFGAAAGRMAVELLQRSRKVIAIDNSILMPFLFHKVVKSDLDFYEFNLRNIIKSEDVCVKHTATFRPLVKRLDNDWQENFQYIVGDGTNCPLISNSVDVIFSSYFLDVVSVPRLAYEIARLLKPGGLFINFGPLHFHSLELKSLYSCEGIKKILSESGIEIRSEKWIQNKHLAAKESMHKNIFNNWFFVAEKKGREMLSDNSIIQLNKPVDYEVKGSIYESWSEKSKILLSDGETIENASAIIILLKFVDGKRSIRTIKNKLCEVYNKNDLEFKKAILSMIELLLKNQLIKVVTKSKDGYK